MMPHTIMMELPQCLSVLTPRPIEAVASAALATQANVVTLRVAFERKTNGRLLDDIRTPAPGAVVDMRYMLIDRDVIRDYSAEETLIRLRQVWGEFCALCWVFPFVDPQSPLDFHALPPAQTLRCCSDISNKLETVQRGLWRVRLEMRVRHDRDARRDPAFQQEYEIGQMEAVRLFGQDVRHCSSETLFHGACEFAGMLAALRWVSDDRWSWEAPGIMDVVLTQ